MVLKSIGSGISRTVPEKNHKHVRVDLEKERYQSKQTLKRAENYKRFRPKVVRRIGQSSDDQQINLGVEQS